MQMEFRVLHNHSAHKSANINDGIQRRFHISYEKVSHATKWIHRDAFYQIDIKSTYLYTLHTKHCMASSSMVKKAGLGNHASAGIFKSNTIIIYSRNVYIDI